MKHRSFPDYERNEIHHPSWHRREDYKQLTRRTVVKSWEDVRGDPQVRRAVILGHAGAGKTWLLYHEGHTVAFTEVERLRTNQVTTEDVVVPVFAQLSALAALPGSLLARLSATLTPPVSPELWKLFEHKAHTGTLLLLLDGWNDVTHGRAQLQKAIQDFAHDYPHCRIYLTSRSAEYKTIDLGRNAEEWELMRFTSQQVYEFIHKYFTTSTNLEDTDKATRLITFLSERTQSPVQDLARIPFMLTLLCRLYRHSRDGVIPECRMTIYHECLLGLLSEWTKEDEQSQEVKTRATQRVNILTEVALPLFQNENVWSREQLFTALEHTLPDKKAEEIGDLINKLITNGVFVEDGVRSDPPLRFLHGTLHEYLVARALAQRINTEGWDTAQISHETGSLFIRDLLDHKSWDPRWHEVITLCAGQLRQPEPLLRMLGTEKATATNPHGDDLFRHRLALAGWSAAEVPVHKRRSCQSVLDDITTQTFSLWWTHHKTDTVTAVTHLTQVFPSLSCINANIHSAPHGAVGLLDYVHKLLRDKDAETLFKAATAVNQLGMAAGTSAICAALQDLLFHQDWYVRSSAVEALGQLVRVVDQPDMLSVLLALLGDPKQQEPDWYVRWSIAWAIGQTGKFAADSKHLTLLLSFLRDPYPDTQIAAIWAIGHLGKDATHPEIAALLRAFLRDADPDIQIAAVWAIGRIETAANHPAIPALLLSLLRTPDLDVQFGAAEAVRQIEKMTLSAEVQTSISKLLPEAEQIMRTRAAEVLDHVSDLPIHCPIDAEDQAAPLEVRQEFLSTFLRQMHDADLKVRVRVADTVSRHHRSGLRIVRPQQSFLAWLWNWLQKRKIIAKHVDDLSAFPES